MIDWAKKIKLLANMIESRRPIGEIRAMARGILELMELEQDERDGFWAWYRHQGTKDERDQAHDEYIEAIRIANKASEILDQMAGGD